MNEIRKHSSITAAQTGCAGKSPAHKRKKHTATRPTGTKRDDTKSKLASRADLIELSRNRWLVVADEHYPEETARLATLGLARTGTIFLMAGQVVELAHQTMRAAPELRVLDAQGLARVLSMSVECVGFDHHTGNLRPGLTSAQLAQSIRIYRPYNELPMLTGMVVGSAYRLDATPITQSGYDEASGLYLVDVNADPAQYEKAMPTGDAELDTLMASLC